MLRRPRVTATGRAPEAASLAARPMRLDPKRPSATENGLLAELVGRLTMCHTQRPSSRLEAGPGGPARTRGSAPQLTGFQLVEPGTVSRAAPAGRPSTQRKGTARGPSAPQPWK